MLFKSAASTTPHERMMAAVQVMLQHSENLYEVVKPEPDKIGYLAAGTIGAKTEKLRRSLHDAANAVRAAGKASGGALSSQDSRELFELSTSKKEVIFDLLHRMSEVHYHRFVQLGMGLPSVVKLGMTWVRDATKNFNSAIEEVAPHDELRPDVEAYTKEILEAEEKALLVYSGVSIQSK